VSWRENAAPTDLLAPLEYTDDGVWRMAPTTMPRPPPAPPPLPADADAMAVGLTPPPPAAPTAAAPTVSATEAALQGQLDMLQQPADSAVPPPAPGPDVDTRYAPVADVRACLLSFCLSLITTRRVRLGVRSTLFGLLIVHCAECLCPGGERTVAVR
jgi:hypothetical protein